MMKVREIKFFHKSREIKRLFGLNQKMGMIWHEAVMIKIKGMLQLVFAHQVIIIQLMAV